MRVLHLVHSLDLGGVETWLLRMLKQIPRSRVAMDICCRDPRLGFLADEVRATGAKVVSAPWDIWQIGFVRRLREILTEGDYDLLHVHVQSVSGIAGYAAKMAGIPVVSTIHVSKTTPSAQFSKNWALRAAWNLYVEANMKYSFRNAARVTSVSQGVMDLMVDPAVRDDRFSVLHLGVEQPPNATADDRASLRKELGWAPDCPLILHVGRFDDAKNQRGVVQIFHRVLTTNPTVRLVLVGDGPARPMVSQLIETLELSPNVRWLGLRRDVPSLMSKSDVLLFPSYREGLPVVALEASAAGLPIVGSNIPGLDEAVRDGSTAFLHPVDDHVAMAASVRRLLEDQALAAEFSRNARRHSDESFSLRAAAERLERLYMEAVPMRRKAA